MSEDNTLLSLIGEDKYAIAYRPKFTALTDSALAAILLQEMIHFWKMMDGKPFYKFKEECEHNLYKEGDSWCEAMGFNKHEFDTALKVIGTKIKKGVSKNDILATEYPERKEGETDEDYYKRYTNALRSCVIFWTDRKRLTWYQLNEPLLCKFIRRIYIDKNEGARYLKKCIVGLRSKKSWEQRRKDSTEVTHKGTHEGTTKESSPEQTLEDTKPTPGDLNSKDSSPTGDTQPEKIYDLVHQHSFHGEPLTKQDGALCGIIAAYLEGRNPTKRQAGRGVVQLEVPATPAEVRKFYSWYSINPDTENADPPVDILKVVKHFKAYRRIHPPQQPETEDITGITLTDEQRERMAEAQRFALERTNGNARKRQA